MPGNEDNLTGAERELAAALGTLTAAPTGINRDRLMFQAGRASIRRPYRIWAVAASALAVVLAVHVVAGPHKPAPEQVAHRPAAPALQLPLPSSVAGIDLPGPGETEYIRLREEVLAHGLSALPEPIASAEPAEAPDAWCTPPDRPRTVTIPIGIRILLKLSYLGDES